MSACCIAALWMPVSLTRWTDDRSAWTLPKALYLFVRYYSLAALM